MTRERETLYPGMDLERAVKQNPDMEITTDERVIKLITNGIEKLEGQCPCVPAFRHDETTLCPCDNFMKGVCHCGIFVKKENKE